MIDFKKYKTLLLSSLAGLSVLGLSFLGVYLAKDKEETQPTPPSNSVDTVSIAGYKEAGYKIEQTIELTKVTGSHVYWKGDRPNWPQKNVKVTVDGVIYFGVVRDGKVISFGKFDWTRPNQKNKGLENIAGGYGVFSDPNKKPKSGDKVFICITKIDGSARTPTSNTLVFP